MVVIKTLGIKSDREEGGQALQGKACSVIQSDACKSSLEDEVEESGNFSLENIRLDDLSLIFTYEDWNASPLKKHINSAFESPNDNDCMFLICMLHFFIYDLCIAVDSICLYCSL